MNCSRNTKTRSKKTKAIVAIMGLSMIGGTIGLTACGPDANAVQATSVSSQTDASTIAQTTKAKSTETDKQPTTTTEATIQSTTTAKPSEKATEKQAKAFNGKYKIGKYEIPCSIDIDDYIDADNNVDLYQMAIDAGFETQEGSWTEDARDSMAYERVVKDTRICVFFEGSLESVGVSNKKPIACTGVLFSDLETYRRKPFGSCYFEQHAPQSSKYKLFNGDWSVTREQLIVFAYFLDHTPDYHAEDPLYRIFPSSMVSAKNMEYNGEVYYYYE